MTTLARLQLSARLVISLSHWRTEKNYENISLTNDIFTYKTEWTIAFVESDGLEKKYIFAHLEEKSFFFFFWILFLLETIVINGDQENTAFFLLNPATILVTIHLSYTLLPQFSCVREQARTRWGLKIITPWIINSFSMRSLSDSRSSRSDSPPRLAHCSRLMFSQQIAIKE